MFNFVTHKSQSDTRIRKTPTSKDHVFNTGFLACNKTKNCEILADSAVAASRGQVLVERAVGFGYSVWDLLLRYCLHRRRSMDDSTPASR